MFGLINDKNAFFQIDVDQLLKTLYVANEVTNWLKFKYCLTSVPPFAIT